MAQRASAFISTSISACRCRIPRRFDTISRSGWSTACRCGAFHYVDGECEPAGECRRLGELIREHPIDVALVGIGENGHLAFNDPPADFQTDEPYIVVELDAACRRQQLGEGWFTTLAEVPARAISMSIRQIMKSRTIVCSVPDRRKAAAVQAVVEGPFFRLTEGRGVSNLARL